MSSLRIRSRSRKGKRWECSCADLCKKITFMCTEQGCPDRFDCRKALNIHCLNKHILNFNLPHESYVYRITIRQPIKESKKIVLTTINTLIPRDKVQHICVDFFGNTLLPIVFEEIGMSCSEVVKTLLLQNQDIKKDTANPLNDDCLEHFKKIAPTIEVFHGDLKYVGQIANFCTKVRHLSIRNQYKTITDLDLKWMDEARLPLLKTFIFYDNCNLNNISFGKFHANNPNIQRIFTNSLSAFERLLKAKTSIRFIVVRVVSIGWLIHMIGQIMQCKNIYSLELYMRFKVNEMAFRAISVLSCVDGLHFELPETFMESLDAGAIFQQRFIRRLCMTVRGELTYEIADKLADLFPNLIELNIRQTKYDLQPDVLNPFIARIKNLKHIHCNQDIDIKIEDLEELRSSLPGATEVMLHSSKHQLDTRPIPNGMIKIDEDVTLGCQICTEFYFPIDFSAINEYLQKISFI